MIAPDAPIMRLVVMAEWVDKTLFTREVWVPAKNAIGVLMDVKHSETYHKTRLLLGTDDGLRWVEVKANDLVYFDGLSLGGAS